MADNGKRDEQNKGGDGGEHEDGKKPFEGEFDAERAARLIENLRGDIASLKEERDALKGEKDERDDAEKTEIQRLTDRLAAAEQATKDANRALFVAKAQAKHGLSDEDAEEFLSGLDDEEKILARAERIAGRLNPGSQEENGGDGGDNGESGDDGLSGKPKPGLRPGTGGSGDDGEIDEDALVNAARERRGY